MSAIDDNALILHYYGEDETPQQRDLIAQALRTSPELRARYARLRNILAAAAHDVPAAPDSGFEQRLWQDFNTRLAGEKTDAAAPRSAASALSAIEAPLPVGEGLGRGSGEADIAQIRRPPQAAHSARQSHRRPRWRTATAIAASVLVVLTTGFLAGRLTTPDIAPATVASTAPTNTDPQLATRILDAYVAAHLRETEGVLLTAMNSDSPDLAAGNADLAAALIDSNRLYTQAAQRAGNTRLAAFLQQMEPVLIELANPPRGDGIEVRDGLREYVRESDLLFQVRATEGALATRNLRT